MIRRGAEQEVKAIKKRGKTMKREIQQRDQKIVKLRDQQIIYNAGVDLLALKTALEDPNLCRSMRNIVAHVGTGVCARVIIAIFVQALKIRVR